jgi:endonuclease-8
MVRIETWGKIIFLIFSGGIFTRTHFMLFGSYRIDDPKINRIPRVELHFDNGTVYFYACAFSMNAEEIFSKIDHRVDVLSDDWDEKFVARLLKEMPQDTLLCDLFLDQSLFAGSGNIVKNEVLFNLRRHPETKLSDIDRKDYRVLCLAIRNYCEDFYIWKLQFELRQHWQVYKRKVCRLCGRKLEHEKLGKLKRSTFYCSHCQKSSRKAERLVLHEVLPVTGKGMREPRLDH